MAMTARRPRQDLDRLRPGTPSSAPPPLYPLRFEPIYEYRLWGGRRLAHVLAAPLPGGPVGEAWVLSDRDDHPSRVAAGPLRGLTIARLLERSAEPLLGALADRFKRLPVLLKFLDARAMLSVQVHPSDARPGSLPAGETGKSEAWVVLYAGRASCVYVGLKPGTGPDDLRRAVLGGVVTDLLVRFTPRAGDAFFIPAGTVHALGGDIVVFEVQQNSDATFRLYDWGHVDPRTGQRRAIQVDEALASIDFAADTGGRVSPVVEAMTPVRRERLVDCDQFRVWRLHGARAFPVGTPGVPRVLVCIAGSGHIAHGVAAYAIRRGDVMLLPAVLGTCAFHPHGAVSLLEIALPE